MVEETVATGRKTASASVSVPGSGRKPMPLSEIDTTKENRISLNNAEVDRILGGGLVEGLVLVAFQCSVYVSQGWIGCRYHIFGV